MTTLRLVIESPPSVTRIVRYRDFPVRIGRDPKCECRLEAPFVSRVHAQLDLRAGRLLVRDEGSRAGTRSAAGQRLLPPRQWVDME